MTRILRHRYQLAHQAVAIEYGTEALPIFTIGPSARIATTEHLANMPSAAYGDWQDVKN